tara:strand:+ start:599 stop:778 length:180 start_codon:yes stop_codon:yes gene_type:complete
MFLQKGRQSGFPYHKIGVEYPSFLFGTHWGMLPMIQSHSKHKTDELMEQQRTPAAYVFF